MLPTRVLPSTLRGPSIVLKRESRRTEARLRTVVKAGKDPVFNAASARAMQEKASENLALLLKAQDLEATCAAMVEELTENFFIIASTYLEMAKKEKEPLVVEKLESVLRVAMQIKNKSLRIEIQVLFLYLLPLTCLFSY